MGASRLRCGRTHHHRSSAQLDTLVLRAKCRGIACEREARWDLSSPCATTNPDHDVRKSGRFAKRYTTR